MLLHVVCSYGVVIAFAPSVKLLMTLVRNARPLIDGHNQAVGILPGAVNVVWLLLFSICGSAILYLGIKMAAGSDKARLLMLSLMPCMIVLQSVRLYYSIHRGYNSAGEEPANDIVASILLIVAVVLVSLYYTLPFLFYRAHATVDRFREKPGPSSIHHPPA